ncbi:MAG: tetratricopeptide repeat protein [Bacteroidetes bacterium]|nr:tetratricopeptide repeat protein [Bacteroidota bacterium]
MKLFEALAHRQDLAIQERRIHLNFHREKYRRMLLARDPGAAAIQLEIEEGGSELGEACDVLGDAWNDIGATLAVLGMHREAEQAYARANEHYNGYPYAFDNLATLYARTGNYASAWCAWNGARWRYEDMATVAYQRKWPGHFVAQGELLREVFGDLDAAAAAYRQGIDLMDGQPWYIPYVGLFKIAVERRDEVGGIGIALETRSAFVTAVENTSAYLESQPDLDAVVAIGEMHLLMENYGAAEEIFLAARTFDSWCAEQIPTEYMRSAVPAVNLGVLCVRRQCNEVPGNDDASDRSLVNSQFVRALGFFTEAVRIDPEDLAARSNRAEVLLRLGRLDDAEREYRAILRTAPGNVDSLVGLAELYLERGSNGDQMMLQQAKVYLDDAIRCIDSGISSKRINGRGQAQILHLRGYTLAKLLMAERGPHAMGLASNALHDFRNAIVADPDLHVAQHAAERMKLAFGSSMPVRWFESYMPLAITALGVALVAFSTLWLVGCIPIYSNKSLTGSERVILSPPEFIAMVTMGFAIMIVGSYLPRILKLKMAGVEIEKSTMDNIDTVCLMSISRVKR